MPLSTIFQLYRGGKKYPYKQRYIAGSAKCSMIPLSKLLTSINSFFFTKHNRANYFNLVFLALSGGIVV
jgi:hypothetical protein